MFGSQEYVEIFDHLLVMAARKPWMAPGEEEQDEVSRKKAQLLRQIKQRAKALTNPRPVLVKHRWTISPTARKEDEFLNLTAPPSTKYSPNVEAISSHRRGPKYLIKPLQKHFRRQRKEGESEEVSRLTSSPEPECSFKPNLSANFLLSKKGAEVRSLSPSLTPGPLISKTVRKFQDFDVGTPPPGSYTPDPGFGAKLRGGRLSMLPRFDGKVSQIPGPGSYTPAVIVATNTRGTEFGKAKATDRGMINEKRAARIPGPGTYEFGSAFDDRSHEISMVAASFFSSRIAFDSNIRDPALIQDINFVRNTAQDIARIKLMNSMP